MARRTLSWMRLRGLLRKEILQIRRDPSSWLLGIVMPVVLLFLFGFGVSLDPRDVPVLLVVEDDGPAVRDLIARFELSPYFRPVAAPSMAAAEEAVRRGRGEAIVRVRDDFSRALGHGEAAPVQLIVDGVDANRARLIQGYVGGAIGRWQAIRAARGEAVPEPPIAVEHRFWFNADADSTNYLVPGLLTLIMTLIGTLLTALVVAREWERGTMEAILATPLRRDELLLGKIVPYFALGLIGMGLSIVLGVFVFDVPLRGSLPVLLGLGSVFLLASLGLGLLISAATRVQFVAAMLSVVVGFLPAFFLSGLLFDLDSTPVAIRVISHVVPARYFVTISQTVFLAGDVRSVLLPAGGVLAVMAIVLLALARHRLIRRLPS